jgi:thioredoxin 2
VDTEQAQGLAARLNIRSIPTLALFQGGREVARQPGALTRSADIEAWARDHVR